MAMSKLVCINKLIHMFTHFGFATQKRFKKCPSLMKLLPDMMIIIYDDMSILGWDEEEDANVQKSNGKKREICVEEIRKSNSKIFQSLKEMLLECRRVHARFLLFLQSATRQQQQRQVSDRWDHHKHQHHYHVVLLTQKKVNVQTEHKKSW